MSQAADSQARRAPIVMLAGLPGTGKSAIARELARELPGIVLDKDLFRAALFPAARIEYSTTQDDFCLQIMLQVAGYLVRQNTQEAVILDGRTFSRAYQVALVEQQVAALGAVLIVVECVCSDETARLRLEHDMAEGLHVAGNRNYALYQAIKARFEPIGAPKLVLDTDEPLEVCIERCLSYIRASQLNRAHTSPEML